MPKMKAAHGPYMAAAIEQGSLHASSCQPGEELELELPPLEDLPKNIAVLMEGRNADSVFSRVTFNNCLADNMANIRLNTIDGSPPFSSTNVDGRQLDVTVDAKWLRRPPPATPDDFYAGVQPGHIVEMKTTKPIGFRVWEVVKVVRMDDSGSCTVSRGPSRQAVLDGTDDCVEEDVSKEQLRPHWRARLKSARSTDVVWVTVKPAAPAGGEYVHGKKKPGKAGKSRRRVAGSSTEHGEEQADEDGGLAWQPAFDDDDEEEEEEEEEEEPDLNEPRVDTPLAAADDAADDTLGRDDPVIQELTFGGADAAAPAAAAASAVEKLDGLVAAGGALTKARWEGARYEGPLVSVIFNRSGKPEKRAHGVGKLTFANGDVYEGPFHQGQRHGKGKLTYAEFGDEFVGEWRGDKQHGHGRFSFADGSYYEGDHSEGVAYGKGEKVFKGDTAKEAGYADGTTYIGQWQDNEFHGRGTLTGPDDEVIRDGEWRNGEAHDVQPASRAEPWYELVEDEGHYAMTVENNYTLYSLVKELRRGGGEVSEDEIIRLNKGRPGEDLEKIYEKKKQKYNSDAAVAKAVRFWPGTVWLPRQAALAYKAQMAKADKEAAAAAAEAAAAEAPAVAAPQPAQEEEEEEEMEVVVVPDDDAHDSALARVEKRLGEVGSALQSATVERAKLQKQVANMGSDPLFAEFVLKLQDEKQARDAKIAGEEAKKRKLEDARVGIQQMQRAAKRRKEEALEKARAEAAAREAAEKAKEEAAEKARAEARAREAAEKATAEAARLEAEAEAAKEAKAEADAKVATEAKADDDRLASLLESAGA